MSYEEKGIVSKIKTIEEHIVKWLLGLFTTSITVLVIFYFTTKSTLAQHTKDIKEVRLDINKIDNTPELNTLKINNVNKEVGETKSEVKEVKKDLKEFREQYSKDKEQIIRILYEIKNK